MRQTSSNLIALLKSRVAMYSADLFTFALSNGTFIYLTSFAANIVVGGVTYSSVGPAIKRTSWEVKNTIDVPSMTIDLASTGSDSALGNIKLLIHNGLFDKAQITLARVFMLTAGVAVADPVVLFSGATSSIDGNAVGATITVKGQNVLMQSQMPKNEYKLTCINSLYDGACTVVRSTKTITGTVGSGVTPTATSFVWGSVPANPGYYQQGVITFTSGANAGVSRTIRSANSTGITVVYPFYAVPAVGDAWSMVQGCARTPTACTNQFGNFQHFRGFLSIPPAETAA